MILRGGTRGAQLRRRVGRRRARACCARAGLPRARDDRPLARQQRQASPSASPRSPPRWAARSPPATRRSSGVMLESFLVARAPGPRVRRAAHLRPVDHRRMHRLGDDRRGARRRSPLRSGRAAQGRAADGADEMRIAVLGVGLIGGSIGLAARERAGATVSPATTPLARGARARARARRDRPRLRHDRRCGRRRRGRVRGRAGRGAGSEPVGEALGRGRPTDCVVTDVGSTKRAVVAAHDDPRFVGGHPLAGAETAGVEHARADLFEGATWFLTPTPATSGMLYERLHRLLRSLGAPPGGDRSRHPRHDPGHRLAPAARARQRARRPGRASACGGRRAAAGRPARASATRPGWPARRARSGPTSTSPTATRWRDEIDADDRPRLQDVRDALRAGDAQRITAWNDAAAVRPPRGCSRASSPAARCSSCAPRCPTAPA